MRFLIIILVIFVSNSAAIAQITRDFDTFVHWLSGSWDNEIQTFNENYNKVAREVRQNRSHMVYQAIKSDHFPGILFVKENYGKEGIRAPLNYITIHHMYPDVERQAIAHAFLEKNEGDWDYLTNDIAMVATITPEDVFSDTKCMMYWTKEGGQFSASTNKGDCRVGKNNNLLNTTSFLSNSDLWRREIVLDTEGKLLSGNENFEKFRKATYYTCGGRYQDNAGRWVYFQNQSIHNQGDLVWFGDKNLGVQIRQIIWTTGTFDNATALQTFQNGKERATVNSHAALNTSFIGTDHPEFVVNCKR